MLARSFPPVARCVNGQESERMGAGWRIERPGPGGGVLGVGSALDVHDRDLCVRLRRRRYHRRGRGLDRPRLWKGEGRARSRFPQACRRRRVWASAAGTNISRAQAEPAAVTRSKKPLRCRKPGQFRRAQGAKMPLKAGLVIRSCGDELQRPPNCIRSDSLIT